MRARRKSSHPRRAGENHPDGQRRPSGRSTTTGAMEENHEFADLIGRLGPGQELADELLRRWLDDPDAAPQWQRLAEDVRVDEPLD